MIVELMAWTDEPETLVSDAARLCFGNNPDGKYRPELIRKLVEMRHMSPLEHATFTFLITGISRACSHQLVRYRVASYSQQSQRYTDANRSFVAPPSIEENRDAKIIYDETLKAISDGYERLKALLGEDKKEDCRYLLPNATTTKIMVTMNARELLHFFEQRLCMKAQGEIREMANLMLENLLEVAPVLFETAGPLCTKEKCKEERPCRAEARKAKRGVRSNGEEEKS